MTADLPTRPTMLVARLHGPRDVALRERMAWPADILVPLPDAAGDEDAGLHEPLGVVLHTVDLAAVAPGMRAAVVGCGPIGLLIIRALRAAGVVDVAASDPLAHRVAAAEASGAVPFDGSDAAGPPEVDVASSFTLADAPAAFLALAVRQGLKVVVRPGAAV